MARSIKAKSPAKRPKKQERFILVDLNDELDPDGVTTEITFRSQEEAEEFAVGYEPETQVAVAKIISISDEPEPQPPKLIFKPV